MGRGIIKIKDKYLEWSTIVDAPITYGMSLDELKQYIKDEYGNQGLSELPLRLERVEENGTSFRQHLNLNDTLMCNRAGVGETEITANEIYQRYCVEKPD